MASFDLWSDHLPHLEIYGALGVLRFPDRDRFDGDVTFKTNRSDRWEVVRPVLQLTDWSTRGGRLRGLGVADLVESLRGRPQRTTAEVAYYVLEVLESIELSSTRDSVVYLTSAPARPEPVLANDLGGIATAP